MIESENDGEDEFNLLREMKNISPSKKRTVFETKNTINTNLAIKNLESPINRTPSPLIFEEENEESFLKSSDSINEM